MQKVGKELMYSPHDLIAYLEGDFASWMDRLHFESKAAKHTKSAGDGATLGSPKPDEDGEEMELLKRRGKEHEARYLAELVKQHPDLVTIDSAPAPFDYTVAAMEAGRSVIYQGCLRAEPLLGYPDFLFRVLGESKFGKFSYEPSDTKLAKSAKPHFIVQLCAYADMLEAIQGRRPQDFVFRLGDGADARFRTDEFFYYYRRLKRAFLAFQEAFNPTKMPEPGLERSFGRWSGYAAQLLEKSDHLSRVARITRTQIKRLEAAGISTMTALAKTGKANVPRLQPDVLSRLKAQASLQLKSRGMSKPLHQVVVPTPEDPRRGVALLPPPSKLDVFFDIEGFPLVEGGLEYLFGAVTLDGSHPQYADWWAHDSVQERSAFENFVDWAHRRWKKAPAMHIYHYAAYETSALRRLMGKYASREAQVDDLLRHQVFVDLYTVVRQGVLIGTPSYSLKDVERLYMPPRQGQVVSASGSVVAYQKWLDSGEPGEWQKSKILAEIRDYNRVDCESLVGLRDWLLGLQGEYGIAYLPEAEPEVDKEATDAAEPDATVLSRTLLKQVEAGSVADPDRRRVQELLAWLLEFHWREAKPVFWRMFDRQEMTEQELVEDLDCLGGLQRTKTPQQPDKRSWLYEYAFDPDQDTKLHEDSKCFFAHDLGVRTGISRFDPGNGLLWLKLGPSAPKPPDRLSLIPDEHVSAKKIADAVLRYVEAWAAGKVISRAVDDLLHRRRPRIRGMKGGQIVSDAGDLLPQIVDVVNRLDRTTLCVQGPPGTGKTYASGEVIADLLKRGKRVGVTANSHKAIMKTMESVVEAMGRNGATAPLYKVGGDVDDPLVADGLVKSIEPGDIVAAIGAKAVVVGGTAWAFSRPELEQQFDYLFIDEAGQFSLANVVAVGLSAANLVLVGDQMQLAQPVQGSHPGESGRSGLEYLLDGHDTIPPDFGVFLGVTRRLHPGICRFISDAVYEGRLEPHPITSKRSLTRPKGSGGIDRTSGVLFVPVEHEGNAQCCDEEVETIAAITKELADWRFVSQDRASRKLSLADDILFVAPYNMQVRKLQQRLGPSARVGSVDKFQGQEAPVVIVSMCASSLEDCPRGAEFLLNRNRINVAVSRAQCLAIVVGCPAIMAARCQSIEQMRLVNLFCRLVDYSDGLAATKAV